MNQVNIVVPKRDVLIVLISEHVFKGREDA